MASNKSNRNRKNRSKFIPIANHILNSTSKGIEKTAKWIATDHTRIKEYDSVTESLQRLNYLEARQSLIFRLFDRRMKRGYLIPSRTLRQSEHTHLENAPHQNQK